MIVRARPQRGQQTYQAAPSATANAPARPAITPAVRQRRRRLTPRPMANQAPQRRHPDAAAITTPTPHREYPGRSPCHSRLNRPPIAAPIFTGPNPRCGPQAVHPGDAARGLDRTSSLDWGQRCRRSVRLVRYPRVQPARGALPARHGIDDRLLNPLPRPRGGPVGQRQMEQVWTNTLARGRLVGDPPPAAGFARAPSSPQPNSPAEIVPARVTVIRPLRPVSARIYPAKLHRQSRPSSEQRCRRLCAHRVRPRSGQARPPRPVGVRARRHRVCDEIPAASKPSSASGVSRHASAMSARQQACRHGRASGSCAIWPVVRRREGRAEARLGQKGQHRGRSRARRTSSASR